MKTVDFKYFKFPFEEFNVVQNSVIPFVEVDCNIVLSATTSVGKTAIAESAYGYHLQKDNKNKVVYIAPYRSLCVEKYESWILDPQLDNYRILINTGDYRASRQDCDEARVLLFTCDSFLSKIRNRCNEDWIEQVSCLVIDEAHMIKKEGRGDRIESALMTFTKINPKARVIALSATMSNVQDIARWLKMLNGKQTKFFKSEWSPVEIHSKFWELNGHQAKLEKVFDIVESRYFSEKIIIFVHSKVIGKELTSFISKRGIPCAFHNASISKDKREKIEELFRKKDSRLNVIVSTSTLSTGVNLA